MAKKLLIRLSSDQSDTVVECEDACETGDEKDVVALDKDGRVKARFKKDTFTRWMLEDSN